MLVHISQLIWEKKYKNKEEKSFEDTFLRVAKAIADNEIQEKKFFEIMSSLKFIPGGRILAYAGRGNEKATLSNCYVMPDPEDSMDGIMKALHECALTMKAGGGIGLNFSNLRPAGSYVKGTDSVSSGPVSFMNIWNSMSRTIAGVGHRKGAMMAVMNIDHPDIELFIKAKKDNCADNPVLEMFNISVAITDDFIKAVAEDRDWELKFSGKVYKKVKARVLWHMIVENNWTKAEPGVIFIDKVNRKNNLWYCEKITATNPCVTKDTRLLTASGFIKVEDLINNNAPILIKVDKRACKPNIIATYSTGKTAQITNDYGEEYKICSPVFKTGTAKVYKVITKHGYEVKATDYHKFLTPEGYKQLKDLKPGDSILIYSGAGGYGDKGSYELGLVTGWLIADGYISGNKAALDFYKAKKELAPIFEKAVNKVLADYGHVRKVNAPYVKSKDRISLCSQSLFNILQVLNFCKNKVPEYIWQGKKECVKGFLQAIFTADGTILNNTEKSCKELRLTSISLEFLKEIQILLLNFGIVSKIYTNRKSSQTKQMPDGKGGKKEYYCKEFHDLSISKANLIKFNSEIGLLGQKGEVLNKIVNEFDRGPYKENYTTVISDILYYGHEDVYDVTEPETHSVVFNGLVTGNCGEQPLPPGGACTLGAINLTQFILNPFTENASVDFDDLINTVNIAVEFLDNTVDKNYYPLKIQEQEAYNKRRIGLGIMGLGSAFAMLGVRYDSEDALKWVDAIMSTIRDTAYIKSVELAKDKGSFPYFDKDKYLYGNPESFAYNLPKKIKEEIKKYGIRNSHLLTVAPTGSIAQLANNVSSGVEPIFSLSYIRKNYNENFEVEDYAWKIYKTYNNSDKPDYFVTAHEISPEWHIKVMAQVQKYIDASVSKTINLPEETTIEQMKDIYMVAYDSGLKGCTTYRAGCLETEILSREKKENKPKEIKFYERPYKLESKTYKVKIPGTQHAYYLTFSYEKQGGKNKPIELFINTKDTSMEEWTKLIGRMVSAVFRQVDDPAFLIEEFKQIYSPSGFFSPKRRKFIPSLQAEFGEVMKDFFIEIGILDPEIPVEEYENNFGKCPACGKKGAIYEEGCIKCLLCGYSKCG